MQLEIRDVRKAFRPNALTALDGVTFTIETGQFVTLIGPSGSGKSTLCNLIAGLLPPDSGDIRLEGRSISSKPGHVAYMPQRDLLLPWRSVLENAILGPEIAGQPRPEARRRARELLPLFGLEGFADSLPAQLSGGMRQRVALLRTFLQDKGLMVLDEPFGALDALTRRDLQGWLLKIWDELRPTILFVTHDVREAALLADRVLVLSPRPGRIVADVPIRSPRPRQDSDDAFIAVQMHLLRVMGVSESR